MPDIRPDDFVTDGLLQAIALRPGTLQAGRKSIPAWLVRRANGDTGFMITDQMSVINRDGFRFADWQAIQQMEGD